MAHDFVAEVIGIILLVAIPTTLVYWRNRGKLSLSKSYLRGMLHYSRVLGWVAVVFGSIFAILSVAALTGARRSGNWPWWSILASLAFIGIGYGVRRLARFVLNDAGSNNMFASKDRYPPACATPRGVS